MPDTTSRISFTDNNTKFNSTGVSYIIGPYDDYALARAVELKEAGTATHVSVLNIGGSETESSLRKALAIGADDAFRIDVTPTDSVFVASQIAAFVKEKQYDLVLMGRESIDYNGGLVHGLTAEYLGWPCVSPVMQLELNGNNVKMAREIEGGKEFVELSVPFVAGCQEPIAEWKIPSMRGIMTARTKPLQVLQPYQANILSEVSNYEMPPAKSACKMFAPDDVAGLVNALKREAKVLN